MPYPMGEYMDRSIVVGTEKGRLFFLFCCCKNSIQNGGVKTVGGGVTVFLGKVLHMFQIFIKK